MNKKELKEIEDRFFMNKDHYPEKFLFYHYHLCYVFSSTKYDQIWENYWKIINTRNKAYAWDYLDNKSEYHLEEAALLRLVILHDFLRHIGEIK
jgi:hypothetical protein